MWEKVDTNNKRPCFREIYCHIILSQIKTVLQMSKITSQNHISDKEQKQIGERLEDFVYFYQIQNSKC